MRVFIVIIAVIVLASGIAYSKVQVRIKHKEENESVFSIDTQENSVTEDKDDEESEENKKTFSYTQEPTNTPIPQPTLKSNTQPTTNLSLNSFIYPGSEVLSLNDDSLALKTYDNSDKVTDWYKEKIISMDMGVKSFVTTKTNDNILNKLVGAEDGLEIRVEIKSDESVPHLEISVILKIY